MNRSMIRCLCALATTALLSSGLSGTAFALEQQTAQQAAYGAQADDGRGTEENGITVTTAEAFKTALAERKSPIIVEKSISINDAADSDNRMLPVEFPADTIVQGAEGIDITFRSPIQLAGDGVCFKNIGIKFNSTNALGSVPHREIFLAGHSLTLDNVRTYLKGAGSDSNDPMLGTEDELLPTVYAGGFTTVQGEASPNGTNASLTVQNSNRETMLQAVYLGHGAQDDNKSPYQGNAVLHLDAGAIVRDGVDASLNSQAEILISDKANTHAGISDIYGNDHTNLTVNRSTIEGATVINVGNTVLQEGACLSLMTAVLRNVTLRSGACLDLNGAGDVVIAGDFAGVENQTEERGILVVGQEGSLEVAGAVTGTTQLQTKSRYFPGAFTAGKSYVTVKGTSAEDNFVLSQSSLDNGFKLNYSSGIWTVDREQTGLVNVSRIEVLSSPGKADLRKIAVKEDGTIPDETAYFELNWYDENGEIIDNDVVEDYVFYDGGYIVAIKTEYWKSDDPAILDRMDWAQPVFLMSSEQNPGKYYMVAYEGAQPGDYTFLFCSDYCEKDLNTVADVKALSSTVLEEQRVVFYDQDSPDPGEHEHAYQEKVTKEATCTETGVKTYTCSCGEKYTEEIAALGHKEVIDAAVAPTETTEGKTEGSHCSVCNKVLKEPQTIPATGKPTEPTDPEEPKDPEEHTHSYYWAITKQATCTQTGVKTYVCSCGDNYTEVIPALGHRYRKKSIPATLKKDGSVKNVCSVCFDTKVAGIIYRAQKIVLNKTDYIYNGKIKSPSVSVRDSKGKRLAAGKDYQVSYGKGRKNPGVYTVTITLKGDYSGKLSKTFTIRPKGSSLGKITANRKGFQASWKKQPSQISGYQLQYGTSKSFKGKTSKIADIRKVSTVKRKVEKLKANKKYYLRVRTYKTVKVNGKSKKLYSDWSKVKSVQTKK